MDDPRTQDALDSLADLFLTQTLGEKAALQAGDPTGELEGPSPIRLAPKINTPASPTPPPRRRPKTTPTR